MALPDANGHRVPVKRAESGARWLNNQIALRDQANGNSKGWTGPSPSLTPLAFLIEDKLNALWGETFASHVFGVCGRRDTQSQGSVGAHSLTTIILLVLKLHNTDVIRAASLVKKLLKSFKDTGNYLGNPLHLAAVVAMMNLEERVETAITRDCRSSKRARRRREKTALPESFLKLVTHFRSFTPFQNNDRQQGLDMFNRVADFFTTYLGKDTVKALTQFVGPDLLFVNYLCLSKMVNSDDAAQRGFASFIIERCPGGVCRRAGVSPTPVNGLDNDVASAITFLTNAQKAYNVEKVLSDVVAYPKLLESKNFKSATYRVGPQTKRTRTGLRRKTTTSVPQQRIAPPPSATQAMSARQVANNNETVASPSSTVEFDRPCDCDYFTFA